VLEDDGQRVRYRFIGAGPIDETLSLVRNLPANPGSSAGSHLRFDPENSRNLLVVTKHGVISQPSTLAKHLAAQRPISNIPSPSTVVRCSCLVERTAIVPVADSDRDNDAAERAPLDQVLKCVCGIFKRDRQFSNI
jgi:hypothetical protein